MNILYLSHFVIEFHSDIFVISDRSFVYWRKKISLQKDIFRWYNVKVWDVV